MDEKIVPGPDPTITRGLELTSLELDQIDIMCLLIGYIVFRDIPAKMHILNC